MPNVRANGIDIYYEIHGQGGPLVMVIGLSANVDWWEPAIIERLSRRYRLLLFDNRGAGRTEKPDMPYTISLMAQDTAALMALLGIERAHILGVSMGGMIAQEFALQYPDRVNKLILACTSCGGKESVSASPEELAFFMRREGSPEEIKRRLFRILFPEEFIASHAGELERFWERILKAPIPQEAFFRQLGAIQTFSSCGRLAQIQAPTLVMTGNRDVLIPPQNSEILARKIPDARLEIFSLCFFIVTFQ